MNAYSIEIHRIIKDNEFYFSTIFVVANTELEARELVLTKVPSEEVSMWKKGYIKNIGEWRGKERKAFIYTPL